jgi:hypothetical protein
MLAPQVGDEQGDRLRRESAQKAERTERLVQGLAGKPLSKEQREVLRTIESFLEQGKAAMAAKDELKAANLIEKAAVLAEELSQRAR